MSAVEGADTTAALRARLGAIDVYARAGAVTEVKTDAEYLTDALRAVLDRFDFYERHTSLDPITIEHFRRDIATALGVGTP